jgi:hypothetical protein
MLNTKMYGLTLLHKSKRLQIKWDLVCCDDCDDCDDCDEDEDTVCFTNASISPESDYTLQLLDENTLMVILYKNIQIVHLYFHPERMIYILQFIHSGSIVRREYYLEMEMLEVKKKYSATYAP